MVSTGTPARKRRHSTSDQEGVHLHEKRPNVEGRSHSNLADIGEGSINSPTEPILDLQHFPAVTENYLKWQDTISKVVKSIVSYTSPR